MTRSVGTSLGVALTGALLSALLSAESGGHVEGTLNVDAVALQAAVHQTLLFLAALAAVSALLSGIRGAPAAEEPESASQPAAVVETFGL